MANGGYRRYCRLNWQKNAGKRNCKKEETIFLKSVIKEGRRRRLRPDVVSIKQPKKSLVFGQPLIIGYSQRNITVPRLVLCCRRFLQDSFILLFSFENMTGSTLPICLLSNLLQSRLFLLNTAETAQRGDQRWFEFRSPEASETQIFSIVLPFCFKEIKISCM